MSAPDPCAEFEVAELVDAFCARARDDTVLGAAFGQRVADRDLHLPKMADFRWGALRGSRNHRAAPMPVHGALSALTQPMFEHGLERFLATEPMRRTPCG